ncbi:MAG: protein phosphatase 2C domain-containing protein [bacterium]|nr:serine/threonine-protein phosphatase [Myxococcales bacterium]
MPTSTLPIPLCPRFELHALRGLAWQGRTRAGLRVSGAVGTHAGGRLRNEDAFAVNARHNRVVVADGMGGHPGGHLAAETAVQSLADLPASSRRGVERAPRLQAMLEDELVTAHERIRARRPQDPARPMATTVVALWFVADLAVYAHVGDSRLYRWRGGRLTPLTLDHNAVGEALRLGVDPREVADLPAHLISRALGLGEALCPDSGRCAVLPGDRYLLCTDGLCGPVDDRTITAVLGEGGDCGAVMRALFEEALRAGAPDNITIAVVDAH